MVVTEECGTALLDIESARTLGARIRMAHPAVDKFGKIVVNKLRDAAIADYDGLASQRWKAPALQQLQADLAALSPDQRAVVRRCVILAIDAGMHDFLFSIVEHHDFDNSILVLVDGHDVAELSDGLHGEQFTEDGWIAKFGAYSETGDPVERGS